MKPKKEKIEKWKIVTREELGEILLNKGIISHKAAKENYGYIDGAYEGYESKEEIPVVLR